MAVLEGEYAEGDTVRVDRAQAGASLVFERVAGAEKPEPAEPKGAAGGAGGVGRSRR
jgi:hypothetical protein